MHLLQASPGDGEGGDVAPGEEPFDVPLPAFVGNSEGRVDGHEPRPVGDGREDFGVVAEMLEAHQRALCVELGDRRRPRRVDEVEGLEEVKPDGAHGEILSNRFPVRAPRVRCWAMLRNLLLFFVAIAGPWVVHLAPKRQRLMALVGFVGVLLLWLVLESWLGKWWFWLGLLIGIGTVLFMGERGGPRKTRPPRPRRPAGPSDLTEEI